MSGCKGKRAPPLYQEGTYITRRGRVCNIGKPWPATLPQASTLNVRLQSLRATNMPSATVTTKFPHATLFKQAKPNKFPPTTTTTITKRASPEVTISYPMTVEDRNIFKTNTGKRLTVHQWAVYDFVLTIPSGKVTTYKDVSLAVGGSPRSVGNALRNNPFSPYVPCHRVIASNHFVGGFFGEWGKDDKSGTRYNQKVSILSQEGVHFDSKGYLKASDQMLLKPGI